MAHVIAVIAATVSTVLTVVVLALAALVVSLGFRARRSSDARKRTHDL